MNWISNSGTIRVMAGASVPVNNDVRYTPISAATWSGSGICQPLGGTWNAGLHQFTASAIVQSESSQPVSLDLASVQRALVTFHGSDDVVWKLGASFVAAASEQDISFTATAADATIFSALETAIGDDDKTIFDAWTLATTNYDVSETNPLYLSLFVGPGYSADGLAIWQYDGANWTPYSPFDLTYDGTYASFTATSLGGFAVATPEPGTFALLAVGLVGALAFVRRSKR